MISAGTSTGTDSALITEVQAAYGDIAQVSDRIEAEILAWLDRLNLARPGLADVWAWRPTSPAPTLSTRARFLVGFARKPPSTPCGSPEPFPYGSVP